MAAVTKICASCGDLFTLDDAETNTIIVVGKSMIGKFEICDQCGTNDYELPINKNAVAGATNTPTAWTSSF
jgi:hypothetical protein